MRVLLCGLHVCTCVYVGVATHVDTGLQTDTQRTVIISLSGGPVPRGRGVGLPLAFEPHHEALKCPVSGTVVCVQTKDHKQGECCLCAKYQPWRCQGMDIRDDVVIRCRR